MKNKLLILFFVIVNVGCRTLYLKSGDVKGDYTQLNADGSPSKIILTLNDSTFTLINKGKYSKGSSNCCDTLTYGKWELDNRHGVLSFSTPEISSWVWAKVEEEVLANRDSLIFYITNPIERKTSKFRRNITYIVSLYGAGLELTEATDKKEYDTNRIAIFNPKHNRISDFAIYILAKPEYEYRDDAVSPLKTSFLPVKDRNANYFKIEMPDLTYGYLTYSRHKNDLAKIEDKGTLVWHGVKYLKN